MNAGFTEQTAGCDVSGTVGFSWYISLQYWACSHQCISGPVRAALDQLCPVLRLPLLYCWKFICKPRPLLHSLATHGGQSRPATLSAPPALWPTECRKHVPTQWPPSQCCGMTVHAHAQVLFYYLWLVCPHSSVT